MSTIGHEPTWLREMVDGRLAVVGKSAIREAMRIGAETVVLPLTEPPSDLGDVDRERWEHTCDHCGYWTAPGEEMGMGGCQVTEGFTGITVILTYGLCRPCYAQCQPATDR